MLIFSPFFSRHKTTSIIIAHSFAFVNWKIKYFGKYLLDCGVKEVYNRGKAYSK